MSPGLEGVLRVDKPEGPTSHDLVALARRGLRTRAVGHTGTLDPFASGLLLLCIGGATRLSETLTGLPKEYVATARLGAETDSGDRDGVVIRTVERVEGIRESEVRAALEALLGESMQEPPALSARKIDGEPAHRRVRRGEEVQLPARPIRVRSMELLAWNPPEFTFRTEVSSGTYIRSLARDLGRSLGSAAHLVSLRRTRIGPHAVGGAATPEELSSGSIRAESWVSAVSATSHLRSCILTAEQMEALGNGRPFRAETDPPALPMEDPIHGPDVALLHEHRLAGLGEEREGVIHPRRVFSLA